MPNQAHQNVGKVNYDLDILNDSISMNMVDDSFEYGNDESTFILPSKLTGPSSPSSSKKKKINNNIQREQQEIKALHHPSSHSNENQGSDSLPLHSSSHHSHPSQSRRNLHLEKERDWLRGINQLLQNSADELDKVKLKLENVQSATQTSHELLDLYSKILTQTEHTKDLLLNPDWKGLTHDLERRAQIKEQERIKLARQRELEEQAAELERQKRQQEIEAEAERLRKLNQSQKSNRASSIPTRGRGTTGATTAGRTIRGKSRISRITR